MAIVVAAVGGSAFFQPGVTMWIQGTSAAGRASSPRLSRDNRMNFVELGSSSTIIDWDQAESALNEMLEQLGRPHRVLLVPPDTTRASSWAGEITSYLYKRLSETGTVLVLPALGTHRLDEKEMQALLQMYEGVPRGAFLRHRHDVPAENIALGTLDEDFISEVSSGACRFSIPFSVNKHLVEGFDRVISIGQVVPHEVMGFANHSKNLFIGCGGKELIDATHWISAVCGIERILGEISTPPRQVLEEAWRRWKSRFCPTTYVLTVRDAGPSRDLITRGLFAGDDFDCFQKAARLSAQVNKQVLKSAPQTIVVSLPEKKYHSLWLGNKAVYRTRMAIRPGGLLVVLAPGVTELGENVTQNTLIGKYGYGGTEYVKRMVAENEDLQQNLGVAAHLIHGSSEGRFKVLYCTRELHRRLPREQQLQLGFDLADYDTEISRWKEMTSDGETYVIDDPGMRLWKA